MEVLFKGSHGLLDWSLHFVDLRGRNVLLNVARWLVALVGGGGRVHVHVEGVEREVPLPLLQVLGYLVYPTTIEAGGRVVEPLGGSGAGRCDLCGRGVLGRVCGSGEVLSHVSQGLALDEACLVARLLGRAANKRAVLFYLGDVKFDRPPDVVVNLGEVSVEFYRHGRGRTGDLYRDDTAVVKACPSYAVSVVGLGGERVREAFRRFVEEVRRCSGEWRCIAHAREEVLGELAEGVELRGRAVYQPGAEGFVPQLSAINAGGELEEVNTEAVALAAGSNSVAALRIDGDRFGEFSRAYVKGDRTREEELAKFKSAVAGVLEASAKAATVYAGGDENLAFAGARSLRPVLEAVRAVRSLFKSLGEEAGFKLTVSAAVVVARYKTPAYYLAHLLNEGVEKAKEAGRDALYIAYVRGLSAEPGGVVKMEHLDFLLRAAAKFAEERPPVDLLLRRPELAVPAYLGVPHLGADFLKAVKDVASWL